MNGLKLAAFALIAAGVLALIYGGFTYTRATHEARVGPIAISMQDNRTIDVPVWAGLGAILIGGVLLFGASKRSQSPP